jgi:hypothetical protein
MHERINLEILEKAYIDTPIGKIANTSKNLE